MTDNDCMIRAICDDPYDDTVRLVYADYLEENGEWARARYIRTFMKLPFVTYPIGEMAYTMVHPDNAVLKSGMLVCENNPSHIYDVNMKVVLHAPATAGIGWVMERGFVNGISVGDGGDGWRNYTWVGMWDWFCVYPLTWAILPHSIVSGTPRNRPTTFFVSRDVGLPLELGRYVHDISFPTHFGAINNLNREFIRVGRELAGLSPLMR
jgi:uncharacterized protein (TIGR02996 family)